MDVRRVEKPQTWDELIAIVNKVAATPDICKTLIIDTADWAEQLCVAHVCQKYKQNSIESFGYGKGYTYAPSQPATPLSPPASMWSSLPMQNSANRSSQMRLVPSTVGK